MFDTDVFVSGGGPAGLAAAIAARRAGFRVILADARRPPIDKACGEGLMPESLAAASRIGIDIPTAEGRPFHGVRFVTSEHSVSADFPDGTGLGIRRTILHSTLVECARKGGIEMHWRHCLKPQRSCCQRVAGHRDGAMGDRRRWGTVAGARMDGPECVSPQFRTLRLPASLPRSAVVAIR